MRITDYDAVTSLAANDVLLIDGDRGTKKILASNVTKESKVLAVSASGVSSLPTTISDSRITSDMVAVDCILSSPPVQKSDWTVYTANGSVTISGTIIGSTNITLLLEKTM